MTLFKNMRKFHNQIKLKYLDEYVTEPSTLLDLASGKGGDIHKWNNNKNIISVDGYDINEESVKESIKRRNTLRVRKRMNFKVLDLGENVLKCKEKYDVITSMFAFHYFFKNKETLGNIIKTLKNCSASGTILILTLFDGSLIKKDIDSKNFYVKLDPENDYRKTTGNSVSVYIKESVLDKPETEYLVIPKKLVALLKKIGFELIEKKNFKELYKQKNLNNEETELSFINQAYVFKKI